MSDQDKSSTEERDRHILYLRREKKMSLRDIEKAAGVSRTTVHSVLAHQAQDADRNAKVVDLRVNGKLSMYDIAVKIGVSHTTVKNILRHEGVTAPPKSSGFWDAHRERLVELYTTTSLPHSEIAAMIGHGVTTAAVSGQILRLERAGKVTFRTDVARDMMPVAGDASASAKAVHPMSATINRNITAAWKPAAQPPVPLDERYLVAFKPAAASARVYTLRQLRDGMCRWPIGDGFCGQPIEARSRRPYCACHQTSATRPGFSPSPLLSSASRPSAT